MPEYDDGSQHGMRPSSLYMSVSFQTERNEPLSGMITDTFGEKGGRGKESEAPQPDALFLRIWRSEYRETLKI